MQLLDFHGTIFDADGTILDSMHIWRELGARYLCTLGIQPEDNLAEILYIMSLEQGCEYLKSHYGIHSALDEIKRGVLQIMESFYVHEVELKAGVKSFLASLKRKNIPMVIATSGDRNLLNAALSRNGIAKYFDAIFTCSELGTDKHDVKIFMACAAFMCLTPENIAVFEDAYFALRTAKNAGFITIGVEDESNLHDTKRIIAISDYYIENFESEVI